MLQPGVHESVLVEDFLYSLAGSRGCLISGGSTRYVRLFHCDRWVSRSVSLPKNGPLDDLICQISPLREQMAAIQLFVDVCAAEKARMNSIQAALSGCESQILQSLSERVFQFVVNLMLRCVTWEAQLRSGQLTLSSLRYQVGDTSCVVKVIHEIISACATVEPSRIIDFISEVDSRNNHVSEARTVCRGLREGAFEPIASLVVQFVLEGDLSGDMYSEFFVESTADGGVVLMEGRAPPSVLAHLRDAIFECGKSASILTRLGVSVRPHMTPRMLEMEKNPLKLLEPNYATVVVGETLAAVNRLLLGTVDAKGALSSRMREFKRFFFISESDWLHTLMDSAALRELEKPSMLISKVRLDDAVKSATGGLMSAELHPFPLDELNLETRSSNQDILGVRAFTLRTAVPYPLILVFTESVQGKFQCIFRHLFFCKYVELKLSGLWTEFQALRMIDTEDCMLSCNMLLQKMLHFIKNYLFYLFVDIIEAKQIGLQKAKSAFEVRDQLEATLTEIINEFNLNNFVYKSINKVLSTCSLFTAHMRRFINMHIDVEVTEEDRADTLVAATSQEKYTAMIEKFEDAFQGQVNSLMVQLKGSNRAHKSAINLIARLDFNEFFSDRMGI